MRRRDTGIALLGLLLAALGSSGCDSCSLNKRLNSTAPGAPKGDDAVGRIVWHELVTVDPKAAAAFYSEVIGWHINEDATGYSVISNDVAPLGGIKQITSDLTSAGYKSYWAPTVDVDNVDKMSNVARESGARVYVGPMDLPSGRFASVIGPGGAIFYGLQPNPPILARDTTKPGEFNWDELDSSNADSTIAFYSTVLGWTKQSDEVFSKDRYVKFGHGTFPVAGTHSGPGTADVWVCYIQVVGLDVALSKALAKGAKVVVGPLDVSDGRMVALLDPWGAVFALHEGN